MVIKSWLEQFLGALVVVVKYFLFACDVKISLNITMFMSASICSLTLILYGIGVLKMV